MHSGDNKAAGQAKRSEESETTRNALRGEKLSTGG
jgi:hypothetical protein